MHSFRISFRHVLLFGCFAFLGPAALAQVDTVNNSTSTPIPGAGHNYIGSLNETVDPGNGSVSVRIDVGTPSGRKLTLPFSFAYDSNGVHFPKPNPHGGSPGWGSNTDILSQGGWSYTVPLLTNNTWVVDAYDTIHNLTYHCWYVSDFIFQDASGGRHGLGVGWNQQATNPCNGWGGSSNVCGSLDSYEVPNGGGGPFSASMPVPNTQCPNPVSLDLASADGTVFHFPVSHCSSSPSCELPPSSAHGIIRRLTS